MGMNMNDRITHGAPPGKIARFFCWLLNIFRDYLIRKDLDRL